MKKSHIIGLTIIAAIVAIIISSYNDTSTYVTIGEAKADMGQEYHVIGELNRNKQLYYEPETNVNYFSFFLIDEHQEEIKVVYRGVMPPDFERSEKVVLVGAVVGEEFEATKILTKCPSKYEDGTTDLVSEQNI